MKSIRETQDTHNIEKAIIDQQLQELRNNPYSYLSRVLSGEVKDPEYLKALQQIEAGNYPFFSKVGGTPNAQQLLEAAAQGNDNRVYAAVWKGMGNYPDRKAIQVRGNEASGVDFGGMVYTTSSPSTSLNYSVIGLNQRSLGDKVMDILSQSGLKFSEQHLNEIRNKITQIEQFQIDHNIKQSLARVEAMKKSGKYSFGSKTRSGAKGSYR